MKTMQKKLSGWGRYPVSSCSVSYLDLPLKDLENFSEHTLTPRGSGRSYGDASLSLPDGLVLQTSRQNQFVAFDRESGILTALPGVTMGDILDVAVPEGWFLPVTPGTRFVTLGGALASNVHGKNHHHSGAFSLCVKECSLLSEKGFFVCSPQKKPDLFYATLGGMGMTGLIQSVTLQLKKIETSRIKARSIKVKDLDEWFHLSEQWEDQYEYAVTWIDSLAKGKHLGRGILMLGKHASLKDLPALLTNQQRKIYEKNPLFHCWKTPKNIPFTFPNAFLNPWNLKAFNACYYHKQFPKEKHLNLGFEPWFYPLDSLLNWNRLYGSRGFTQYQCVIPHEHAFKGIRTLLETLSKHRMGSFLGVLKRMKKDEDVSLPFSLSGYTLSLDIPLTSSKVFSVLDDLDKLVMPWGGRVYLAKDMRLKPETFREMYPEFEQWRHVVQRYSPHQRFYSQLAKRLLF